MRYCFPIAMCVLLIPMLVEADLVIEQKVSIRGVMGIWSSEGDETTYLRGNKMRTESRTEMTGMMQVKMPKKDQPTVTITRLDKELVWFIDHGDSTYTEMALGGESRAGEEMESMFKIKDIKVKQTGEKKEVAGHKCESVDIGLVLETAHEDTVVTRTIEAVFWMTPGTKRLQEMRKFWEAMIESIKDLQGGFPMGEAMEELWQEVREIKGVPLAMDMMVKSPVDASREDDEEMVEAMKTMRQFMKARMGEQAVSDESEEEPDGQMKITREVISISEKKLDDSLFEIPDGYKKKEAPSYMMFREPNR